MVLPVATVPLIMRIVSVLWILIALGLILIILLQKGKGGGLGAAFGGGAGSLLGTKTIDFFIKLTIVLVLLFLLLGVIMVKFYKPTSSEDLSMPAGLQQTPITPTESGGPAGE